MRFLFLTATWKFCIWIVSMLFQYSLWIIAGKDAPWYLDVVGGLVCNGVIVPVAFICWILQFCGVPIPFIH